MIQSEPTPTPRALFIVAVDRHDVFSQALHGVTSFGITGDVDVIRDRRVGERRRPGRPFDEASKRNDRRRLVIDDQLRSRGWALITAEARAAIPPHAPLHIDLGLSGIDHGMTDQNDRAI
jgi:hypothetical protein